MSDTVTETREITKMQTQPPYNVVVHNDPVNMMNYVVLVFRRVFGMGEDDAVKRMLEVHNLGRSVVWTGGREEAEFYVHELQKWKLTVSLEAA